MNTIEYLTQHGSLYWPGVISAVAIAMLGAMLSVIVVLKRLAFVGQGISHAAFGGVGIALMLGIVGATAAQDAAVMSIVVVFAVGAALTIAWLSDRPNTQPDTAIGIVLAGSMALGFLLFSLAEKRAQAGGGDEPPELESVLFGSVTEVGWSDAIIAVIAAIAAAATVWWWRRPLLFWSFDENASRAFGVRAGAVRSVLMIVLAVAVVVAMKLAGVVLATALFVLPGATALQLTDRLGRSLVLSVAAALIGTVGGLVVSFELGWPAGPAIVLVMVGLFAAARLFSLGRRV